MSDMNTIEDRFKQMREKELEAYFKQMFSDSNSKFRTEYDLKGTVLTPATKDNKSYSYEKVQVTTEDDLPIIENGKPLIKLIPRETQLNRINLFNSDLTTGIFKFQKEHTDEKLADYVQSCFDFIENLYSWAEQYKALNNVEEDELTLWWEQINKIALKFRNKAISRILMTKSRDGVMLGLSTSTITKTVTGDPLAKKEELITRPNINFDNPLSGINPNIQRDMKKPFF